MYLIHIYCIQDLFLRVFVPIINLPVLTMVLAGGASFFLIWNRTAFSDDFFNLNVDSSATRRRNKPELYAVTLGNHHQPPSSDRMIRPLQTKCWVFQLQLCQLILTGFQYGFPHSSAFLHKSHVFRGKSYFFSFAK